MSTNEQKFSPLASKDLQRQQEDLAPELNSMLNSTGDLGRKKHRNFSFRQSDMPPFGF